MNDFEHAPEKVFRERKTLNKQQKIWICIAVFLALAAAFLLWFFNRQFQVVFDPANGEPVQTVQVTYRYRVDEKEIPQADAPETGFLGWFEVQKGEGEQTVIADSPFDFQTRITRNIRLQARYQSPENPNSPADAKTFTVTFDTKGGGEIPAVKVNKGEGLHFPSDPEKKGYRFICWETAEKQAVQEGFVPNESLTLFARWKKQGSVAQPEQEDREEHIILSLQFPSLHRFGHRFSQAEAKTENPSGQVEYTLEQLDSDLPALAEIDPKTGKIHLILPKNPDRRYTEAWKKGCQFLVRATLPSGQEDMATLTLEPDLVTEVVGVRESAFFPVKEGYGMPGYEIDKAEVPTEQFELKTNVKVSWAVRPEQTDLSLGNYAGEKSSTPTHFAGSMAFHTADGSGTRMARPVFTIRSEGGQMMDIVLYSAVS